MVDKRRRSNSGGAQKIDGVKGWMDLYREDHVGSECGESSDGRVIHVRRTTANGLEGDPREEGEGDGTIAAIDEGGCVGFLGAPDF